MRNHILALTIIAGLAAAPTAWAAGQSTDCGLDGAAERDQKALARSGVQRVEAAPLEASFSSRNALQITAGAENSTASLRLGIDFDPKIACPGDRQTITSSGLMFTVSTPLSDGETDAQLANLDGLASTVSLDVSFRSLTINSASAIDDEARDRICEQAKATYAANPGHDPALAAKGGCNKSLVRQWDKTRVAAFDKAAWGEHAYVIGWSVNGKVGTESFDYLNTTTLAKLSDDKTSWSVGASAAFQPINSRALFVLGYRREAGWEAQNEVILCPAGGGVLTCVKGAGGAPISKDKDVVSFEYRQRLDDFAFSVNLAYDANDSVTGVEVPIYLASNDDGAMIGGIKLGWRSDDEDFTAVVFIGTPFSLGMP